MDGRIVGGQQNIAADVVSIGDSNRLLTEAISLSVSFDETEKGNGFNINTGAINLTGNATTSALLYVKNNEDEDVILQNLFYILGNSTGGSGDIRVTVVRNPTTGTIIDTTPTDVDTLSNRNFGSNKTLDVLAYKGAEADTLTDGTTSIDTILSGAGQRVVIGVGGIVLTKGSSLGINLTTQAGNSSMDAMIAAEVYKVTLPI